MGKLTIWPFAIAMLNYQRLPISSRILPQSFVAHGEEIPCCGSQMMRHCCPDMFGRLAQGSSWANGGTLMRGYGM